MADEKEIKMLKKTGNDLEARLAREIRYNIAVFVRKAADTLAKSMLKSGWEGDNVIDIYWSWGSRIRDDVERYTVDRMKDINHRVIGREELKAHIEKMRKKWEAEYEKNKKRWNRALAQND
jgi:hypothetical protein